MRLNGGPSFMKSTPSSAQASKYNPLLSESIPVYCQWHQPTPCITSAHSHMTQAVPQLTRPGRAVTSPAALLYACQPGRFHFIACASFCRETGEWKGWGRERRVRVGLSPQATNWSRSIIDRLVVLQEALQKIRQKNTMRREVTVELSSQGFWKTGIRSDVCQVTGHWVQQQQQHTYNTYFQSKWYWLLFVTCIFTNVEDGN